MSFIGNVLKVTHYLYPQANLVHGDIWASQLYYWVQAVELLKPMGISALGIDSMPTKLQFWQARSSSSAEDGHYTTETDCTLSTHFDVEREANVF